MATASLLRELRRRTARKVRNRLHAALKGSEEFVIHRGFRLPPRELRARMCGEAFCSDSFFLQSAVVEATRLAARLGYSRESRLVDIGCGAGRLATGLLAEFGEVDYLGLDANRTFLDWCREHIQRVHPTYRFVHYDVVNELYNPLGTVDGAKIQLPVESQSADIVYLWGVFTNMRPDHTTVYLSEASRIARHGGRLFLTAFVEDDVPPVSYNPPDYVPYDCTVPLAVVQYNRQDFFSLLAQHGLQVEEFRHHGGMFPKQSEIYLVKRNAGSEGK
jgi:SAM-dependent methyltransferase